MKIIVEPLKQPNDSTCVHTTLAMIAGCSVEDVIAYFGHSDALHFTDMYRFLADKGMYIAFYAAPSDGEKYTRVSIHERLQLSHRIKGNPAVVTVLSERFEGKLHQVFFDGEVVHDPSPAVDGPRDIGTYKIVEFWPLLVNEAQAKRLGITEEQP